LLLNPDELAEMTPFTSDAGQTGVGMIVNIRAWRHFDGLLFCYRPDEEQYSPNQVAMTTALADYMSTVIENYLLRRLAESTAIIEERQRLARDLHDSVSQSLYGVMLFARAGRDALESDDREALSTDLARVEENALRALKEMRLLLYQLQPLSLEQGGLAQALARRFEQVEQRLNIETTLENDPDISLPPQMEEELYRLASEALNNALKHADASRVGVQLSREEGAILLTIFDNGRGFSPEQASGAGMGLTNMQFRAEKARGVLSIDAADQGTTIRCRIPRKNLLTA
jgi:signal transduction histidine kinase